MGHTWNFRILTIVVTLLNWGLIDLIQTLLARENEHASMSSRLSFPVNIYVYKRKKYVKSRVTRRKISSESESVSWEQEVNLYRVLFWKIDFWLLENLAKLWRGQDFLSNAISEWMLWLCLLITSSLKRREGIETLKV